MTRGVPIPAVIATAAMIAALYGWAVVALTPLAPGTIGLNLNALGTDFMVFWGGARWFFTGHLAALFDGERFTAYLNATFAGWLSAPLQFRPWVYPPSYLFVVLPFGLLPFGLSYVLFQLASGALLAAALWFGAERAGARPLVVAAALLGPAAAINAGMGQNAFLVAALLVGGLRLAPSRPALGGAVLGLLTMKPQFFLLVPVALAAGRQWRALAASLLAAALLALASLAVFGIACWRHWIALALSSYDNPLGNWMELGRLWGGSIYACLVSGGASPRLANAVQAAGTLLAAALAYRAFRLPLPNDRKIAVLLACAILGAPHSSLADLVLPAVAAALWSGEASQTGRSPAAWSVALLLWLASLVNPPVVSPVGRLTPVLVVGFIAMGMALPGRWTAAAAAAEKRSAAE
jgi:Glycosyltransferase family 87